LQRAAGARTGDSEEKMSRKILDTLLSKGGSAASEPTALTAKEDVARTAEAEEEDDLEKLLEDFGTSSNYLCCVHAVNNLCSANQGGQIGKVAHWVMAYCVFLNNVCTERAEIFGLLFSS
jgi:hypothetical protein